MDVPELISITSDAELFLAITKSLSLAALTDQNIGDSKYFFFNTEYILDCLHDSAPNLFDIEDVTRILTKLLELGFIWREREELPEEHVNEWLYSVSIDFLLTAH